MDLASIPEGLGPAANAGARDAGNCLTTSGTINEFICDLCWLTRGVRDSGCAPDGCITTSLEYRLRITDEGDGNFYCGDYAIFLSSDASGGAGPTHLVYENLGGRTDGGFDDDAEDDGDIYLNWRSTSYFNGESPNQQWHVYIDDSYSEDDGLLNYFELRVHWDCPPVCLCGDLNYDGLVDLGDFATFVRCFGQGSPAGSCTPNELFCSDLSGNGGVDLVDFALFVQAYDQPASGVPGHCE